MPATTEGRRSDTRTILTSPRGALTIQAAPDLPHFPHDERVQHDARYVETRNVPAETVICSRTPLALMRRNGRR